MDLRNKVAIVTGGGTGVGRAASLALAQRGCRVAVNFAHSQTEAEQTAADIQSSGAQAVALKADVADDASSRWLVAQTVKEFGRLDILVNCAGITEFISFDDLEQVTDEVWKRLFKVNVMGAFHCARAVRPAMEKAGRGVIINVSSVAAQIAQGSSIPYCCSKAALDNLTISLARTFAPRIRVNGVAPGFIAGRWLQNGLGANYERIKQAFEKALPLGRVCQPEDVAATIMSLITCGEMVTGQTLAVDGGMLIAGFAAKASGT